MIKRLYSFLAWALPLAAFCAAAQAEDVTFHTAESNRAVTLGDLQGHPALVAFWRSDCAPCIAERPALYAIAGTHPDLRIVLIELNADPYTERHFPKTTSNVELWTSTEDTQTVLLAMGDDQVALPFSFLLRSNGSVCDKHTGMMGTDIADEWVKQC